ncbi:hypothetical protein [Pseudoduganella sp. RAF53_2]|uniref:hypothetical protein n=1 Tax=unclassified Pseudoduganella TaxID=2637179 RepID=UPI003F95337C
MKNITIVATIAALATLAGCSNDKALNQVNIDKAMQTYLAQRGDLCLAKSSWPIDVTEAESGTGSRNGVQMPVLEKIGLVSSSGAMGERKDDDGNVTQVPVRRYALTEEGKKYYLARAPHKHEVESRYATAPHDFCAVKLTLDHVVGWEMPKRPDGSSGGEAVVTYTYQVKPAAWAMNEDVRRVFPMVDNIIRGAGTMQLKESLVLTEAGWEARDL